MLVITFLICFTKTLSSSAEFTSKTDSQTITEELQTNEEATWGNIRHPVTLSIQDGRTDKAHRPQDVISLDGQALFYSNEWQPLVIPAVNSHSDRGIYREDNYDIGNQNYVPLFLQRQNSNLQKNATVNFGRSSFNQMAPTTLNPNSRIFYTNGNEKTDNAKSVQNYSTSETQVFPDFTSTSGKSDKGHVPFANTPITPGVQARVFPRDFYTFPPRFPVYFPPYPISPFAGTDTIQPILNPNINIKSGLEGNENIRPEDSKADKSFQENVPRAVEPNVLQPPYSDGGYPFGIIPPPSFIPPPVSPVGPIPFVPTGLRSQSYASNVLPRSLPFNSPPFTQLQDIETENQNIDASLPVTPVVIPAIASGPSMQTDTVRLGVEVSLKDDDDSIFQANPDFPKLPYDFGFDMNHGLGTNQHRKEVSDGTGIVTGSYGYRDLFGVYRLVNYIADKDGFRAVIKSNEPGIASSSSANVVVVAEPPPPHAVAESMAFTEPDVSTTVEETSDFVSEESVTE